jgi:hypothetical protein
MADHSSDGSEPGIGKPVRKVGYKSPPVSGQFKPNHPGYKKKKGTKNLKTIVMEEVFAPVTFSDQGKKTTEPKLRLVLRQLMNKAAQGDHKAAVTVFTIAMKILPPADEEGEATTLSEAEKAVMRDWTALAGMFTSLPKKA